ncbi:MAG: HPr kinase/phosphorylase, partial [Chlamydiia bacterium]|nr:HPr kinase/phosphorylase [Chlamydiia bacterium]
IGLEERFIEFLDIQVPLYVHPVKPGRDIVLLIETTVLNHRLKEMGYHSAKEFNIKLLEEIAKGKKIEKEG